MRTLLFITWLILLSFVAKTQDKVTISGYLRDAKSGEELLFANIAADEGKIGTVTNAYGFYSLTLPKGKHTIHYSYIGYEMSSIEVELNSNLRKNVELRSADLVLDEVVVTDKKADDRISNTEIGVEKLNIKEAKLIPVLLGEQDVLKTAQLMPGISSAGEGGSGFFVRGGNIDQNLILLDEAPVYNASHLFGFFSVFNSDALKDMQLYKAGIPARYGGRGSSVIDIRMKEGNIKKFSASGGIGLIASRLTLETPIVKDKGSIIVSGRRTYADIFLPLAGDKYADNKLYFYDLNLKANYRLGQNDRIFLSGYFGRDVLGVKNLFGFNWGNKTVTLRWNHLFSEKLFSNTTLIYSNYDYKIEIEADTRSLELSSGIENYNFKQDFTWYANANNTIRFGLEAIHHTFNPGELSASGDMTASLIMDKHNGIESGTYLSNEQKFGDRFTINYGLRFTMFNNFVAERVFRFDDFGEITDTVNHDGGVFNTYYGFEPRVNASFVLNNNNSIKASYCRTNQYLHLVTTSSSGSPTDFWMPSSELIKPQIVDQYSIGYFQNFADNGYELSVEGYYKDLQNQIDYKNGADVFFNELIESQLVFGKGRAYGVEVMLRKNFGKLAGWIGYTLSKSERQFENINDGDWYSVRQDRTHDMSIVATYKLTKKWTLSASWVYNTGDAVTFPSGKYEINGDIINLYTERNGYRIPDYHRLDLGATLKLDSKHFDSDLTFSLYNAYGRKNAYSIDFRESEDNPGTTEAVKISLFTYVPSITWNFNF